MLLQAPKPVGTGLNDFDAFELPGKLGAKPRSAVQGPRTGGANAASPGKGAGAGGAAAGGGGGGGVYGRGALREIVHEGKVLLVDHASKVRMLPLRCVGEGGCAACMHAG